MAILDPLGRHALLDAVKPPPGFSLDCAIGATYTLDLEALLTVPVAFALYDTLEETGDGAGDADPLALVEAVRRYAERMVVFGNAGQLKIWARQRPVMAWLERSVVEVVPTTPDRVFHPKVWLLRFTDGGDQIAFRFLCASRNLTFDRSWDTLVRLDSHCLGEQHPTAEISQPIGDLIAALPSLATQTLPPRVADTCQRVAAEVRDAAFAVPTPFQSASLHLFGLESHGGWPFPDASRASVVVAPFVTAGFLNRWRGLSPATSTALITRAEELDHLGQAGVADVTDTFVLSADTDIEPSSGEAAGGQLEGLHAKLFVVDDGRTARVFAGSANATTAAFDGNVEVLVELTGRRSQVGTEALLAHGNGEPAFRDLLARYTPAALPVPIPADEEICARLDQLSRAIAVTPITVTVTPHDDGYRARITTDHPPLDHVEADLEARCWLATLSEATATEFSPRVPLDTSTVVSLIGMTSFVAFSLRMDGQEVRFLVNATLVGEPENRRERLLAEMLRNRDQFLRYLLLLLSDPLDDEAAPGALLAHLTSHGDRSSRQPLVPLVEVLLRTLARRPERLDHVDRIITDLCASDEGREVLPEGFLEVWGPIKAARDGLQR